MEIRIVIRTEAISSFISRCLRSRASRAIALTGLIMLPVAVIAAVSKPYTFKDGDTISASQVNANFDAVVDGVNAIAANNATFRWAVFSTYHQNGGWFWGNDSAMFGGIAPSTWTDGNATAASLSSSKEVLRTLYINKGYAKANANIWAETYHMWSSTNGRVVTALFRVKNSTSSNITWTPYYYYTSYGDWNEYASVALNGSSVWSTSNSSSSVWFSNNLNLTIPANRVSTVVFVATSSYPYNIYSSTYVRSVGLAFYNNSLSLPSGLSFVDDLDTASGDYSQ